VTKQFTEFKSPTFKNADGIGNTYGLTADGEGNGWWAEMNLDMVAKTDLETGKVTEIKIPAVAGIREMFSADEVKMYDSAGSTWNTATPWAEDRAAWAPTSRPCGVGMRLVGRKPRQNRYANIEGDSYPIAQAGCSGTVPGRRGQGSQCWINLMNSDEVIKYDPKTSQWTEYPFPTLGAETRYISLLETQRQNGNHPTLLPRAKSCAHGAAQRAGDASAKAASAATGAGAGTIGSS